MLRRVATLLLALSLGALGLHARGGGGCVEQGTLIDTPAGPVAVERLQPGDPVWGLVNGERAVAHVQSVYAVEPASYVELKAGGATLRLTAEHPVQIEPGVFRRADRLQAEQSLARGERGASREIPVTLASTRVVPAQAPAYNLMVSPGGVFFADGLAVHNKGCFLPDTPITMADGSRKAISAVQPGDVVEAFDGEGTLMSARVNHVLTHHVESYLVLRTEHVEVHVTEEHPFYVGAGTFKTAEALHTGDTVYVYDGKALAPQHVLALERVEAKVTVYNLQTDSPHTFLANGIAVHNKGGGCFAAGTEVATCDGPRAIETLRLGDTVLAPDATGRLAAARVEGIYLNYTPLRVLHTTRGDLRTTDEHPLLDAGGDFRAAAEFSVGSQLALQNGTARIEAVERGTTAVPVYTLSVAGTHTFLADGFVVHNKGGGGFHSSGGYHGSTYHGSGSGNGEFPPILAFIGIGMFVFLILIANRAGSGSDDEELDYRFPRNVINAKAVKTLELLKFIARTDAAWAPDALGNRARDVFMSLQSCWTNRDYLPMQPLMMRDLFQEHCAQLIGLRQTHEINRIDQLRVDSVDIVQVNYTEKKENRTFTALITATAQDYYVDDRSQTFLRGDESPAQFQEFWTFQLCDGVWKLREIEQSKESSVLTEENFFEPFTDQGRDQIYGKAAGTTGVAGPALPEAVLDKTQKIDRLLNFLVQTDKLWDRDAMLATARRAYTHLQLAWQDGRPEALANVEVDEPFAVELRGRLEANQRNQLKVELRNFCVRKVEIILVNNRDDRRLDSFTTRISAHAQMIISQGGTETRHDEYVKPWTEFWTFRRNQSGTGWSLFAVQPPVEGDTIVAQENTDEGSSQQMLEWYYSKTRAT